ncbi:hypothetical protein B0T14DRAFT_567463 [Immersiella caudata]|uniref:F-box domain-containing protein n=1 Tax=Immersiella caudata TaxID=314043 RepID=A0AA39WSJ7_9PEZI|nr:hypothetical protein B0T14DRAFT_567463 [Immersiella caudata]
METQHIVQSHGGTGQSDSGLELTPEMGIMSLPVELLLSIVWSNRLDQDDVGALRATCRAFAPAAASRLFFRIYISKLIADRDDFIAICNSPHLAHHVREVEWLEISHAVDDFINKFPANEEWTLADPLANLYRYMETASASLFWLFNTPTDPVRTVAFDADAIAATRRDTVAAFCPVFEAAIDKLPNVQAFISRPMTSERVLSNLEYPITAWQFQSFQETAPANSETNDGLFLFLLPAMGRPTSSVAQLRWHEEFPGFSFLRTFPDSAFEGLESLEIHLVQWPGRVHLEDEYDLSRLKAALINASPSLRHFTLGMENVSLKIGGRPLDAGLPAKISGWLSNGHFALRSLSLYHVRVSANTLLQLVRANASSLHHLRTENIPVSFRLMRSISRIQGLRLDSIQIIRDAEEVQGEGPRWGHDYIDDELSTLDEEEFSNDESPHAWSGLLLRKELVSEASLLRFLRGAPIANDDDQRIHDSVNADVPVLISTLPKDKTTIENDSASETESEGSVEYRRRTGPWWAWGRYFHLDDNGQVFAWQVPEESSDEHKTETWRFTSRDSEVAFGDDPLEYFEDWDPEAGDHEEPMPYCPALTKFATRGLDEEDIEAYLGDSETFQLVQNLNDIDEIIADHPREGGDPNSLEAYCVEGPGLEFWKTLKQVRPPRGAVRYDVAEDPLSNFIHIFPACKIAERRRQDVFTLLGSRRFHGPSTSFSWYGLTHKQFGKKAEMGENEDAEAEKPVLFLVVQLSDGPRAVPFPGFRYHAWQHCLLVKVQDTTMATSWLLLSLRNLWVEGEKNNATD